MSDATRDVCVISGGAALNGRIKPPGDKSISHRALMLAALAEGESQLSGLSDGEDVACTARALQALGVKIDWPRLDRQTDETDTPAIVTGGNLSQPQQVLDVGNSGTSMRLLAGLCAGWPIQVTLDGDSSLRTRPMNRIAEPLTQMGATLKSAGNNSDSAAAELTAPFSISGGNLRGIDYSLPVPSAQVKGAILLAGLRAETETIVREQLPTRAHTEEMLAEWGADVTVDSDGSPDSPKVIRLSPSQLTARSYRVPGDPSQAAFWSVAAACVPGSEVTLENVYLGAARDGFIEVLERMQAHIVARPATKMLHIRTSQLQATDIMAHEAPGLIDEIPVLAVAAAHARGTTRFFGVAELRAKESNRLETVAAMINALGGQAEHTDDTLTITGTGGLTAGTVDSRGDHRIAMSAAVAALTHAGETHIGGWSGVNTSYPTFLNHLAQLRGGAGAAETS